MITPWELLTTHTYLMAVLGTMVIGVAAGALSPVVYFRKQALISDVISHASLPGITFAFLIAAYLNLPTRNPLFLATGALLTALLAVGLSHWLFHHTPLSVDTGMAISLSVSFALGMLGLFIITKQPLPGKGGIQDYLLGNASSVTIADLRISVVLSLVILSGLIWWFPMLKCWLFDPTFAATSGVRTRLLHIVAMTAFALVVVNGIKVVGVILMVSFVIAPCVAARQWSNQLGVVTVLAALIGAASCLIGVYLAVVVGSIPTGPLIAVVQAFFALISLVFAPKRGLVFSQ